MAHFFYLSKYLLWGGVGHSAVSFIFTLALSSALISSGVFSIGGGTTLTFFALFFFGEAVLLNIAMDFP
jgi:hypothetical protein